MSTIAVVFPGQGSQRVGMARDFHERFRASQDAFAEASEALGMDVAALCFDEDPRLHLTEFTQPAILTAEIAMFRPLRDELGVSPEWFGGHSLGEYTALCAAGVIPLSAAVKLVRKRGALMQAAVPAGEGAMVAVNGAGIARRDLRSALDPLGVDVANINSSDQIVLSGPAAAIEQACRVATQAASDITLDFTPLSVSAPFHSRAMRSIEQDFRLALDEASGQLSAARAAVVTSNFCGGFHTGRKEDLVDALERQISGPVDWIANMRALLSTAGRIVEVGPNRPLRGFFKTLGVEITSVVSLKTAEKAAAA